MPATITSVTHLAGPAVKLGPRIIQRCLVCGEKLADSAEHGDFQVWSEAGLVLYEGKVRAYVGEFLDLKAMPPDFCLALVECG